jgi:regulatory protein
MDPCYDKAVELLARRPHFSSELRRKLAARGFAAEPIGAAISQLTKQGYLDDLATARSFVESRRGRVEGRFRLAGELASRGVAQAVIDEVLGELPADELPAARAVAHAWDTHGGGSRASLARHLSRKGFPAHVIVAVLEERQDDVAETNAAEDF